MVWFFSLGHSKVIFALLAKIVALYLGFFIIYIQESSLKDFSYCSSGKVKVVRILTSKIVLKIYCRSSFKYLVAEDIIRSSGAELEVKSLFKTNGPSNLSISLLMEEKTHNIRTKGNTKETANAQSLQRRP